MRKFLVILLVICLTSFMAACGSNANDISSSDNPESEFPESFIMLEKGEWPVNEYTRNLPIPDTGTVSEGWIDTDKDYLHIQLTDISEGKLKIILTI